MKTFTHNNVTLEVNEDHFRFDAVIPEKKQHTKGCAFTKENDKDAAIKNLIDYMTDSIEHSMHMCWYKYLVSKKATEQ